MSETHTISNSIKTIPSRASSWKERMAYAAEADDGGVSHYPPGAAAHDHRIFT